MGLLEILIAILIISWLLGFGFSFGGGLIHLLLIIAAILILYRIFRGERL